MSKWAEGFLGGVDGRGELPAAGEKFRQSIHGMGGDAGEHVAQIIERIDLVALAGGDEAEEDRGRRAAVVAATEDPVGATQCHSAERVLRSVIHHPLRLRPMQRITAFESNIPFIPCVDMHF